MSGAKKLKEKIISEASKQAEHVLSEARAAAAEIIKKGEQEAADRKKIILEKARLLADEDQRRAITLAGLDARKRILATKESLIEDVFEQALERLKNIETSVYQDLILPMILAAAESGKEEIIVSTSDRKHFTAGFLTTVNEALSRQGKEGRLFLSEECGEMQGGFILRSGDIEINCSFDSILRMQRDQLEPEVAAILFKE